MNWDAVLQQGGLALLAVAGCLASITMWREGRRERRECERRLDELQKGRIDDLKLILAAVADNKALVKAIEALLERLSGEYGKAARR